jgi:hypothetical protein
MKREGRLYGIAAEFDNPGALLDAARALREQGLRNMEAYTPYPIRALDGIIEGGRNLPLLVLIAGALGTITAWGLQFYIAVIDYPTNIGGRPLNSWPSFIVIMFELTILFAALTAFFGSLGLSGFPLLHHPMFSVPHFKESSNNHFFLCAEARDPHFDAQSVIDLLSKMEPVEINEIEMD